MGKSRAKKHRSSRSSAPRKNPARSTRGAGAAAAVALEMTEAPPSVRPAPEASHEPMVSEIRVCAHLPQDTESAPLEHTPPATSSIRLRVERDDAGADSVPPSGPAETEASPSPAPVVALFGSDEPADVAAAPASVPPVAPSEAAPADVAAANTSEPTDAAAPSPSLATDSPSHAVEPSLATEPSSSEADDLADAFFAKGGAAIGANESAGSNDAWFFDGHGAFGEDDELDSARARKASPAAVARRAQFSRYVAWVVGGASLLCAVAAVREAFRPSDVGAPPPVVVKAADGSLRAEPVRAGEAVQNAGQGTTTVETPNIVLEPVVERAAPRAADVSGPAAPSTKASSAER